MDAALSFLARFNTHKSRHVPILISPAEREPAM
jgi:hypothetical protein